MSTTKLSEADKREVKEALSPCVGGSDVWLEYGIVEYRFKSDYPDLYERLIEKRGHRELGNRFGTTSNCLGQYLGLLAGEGEISRPETTEPTRVAGPT